MTLGWAVDGEKTPRWAAGAIEPSGKEKHASRKRKACLTTHGMELSHQTCRINTWTVWRASRKRKACLTTCCPCVHAIGSLGNPPEPSSNTRRTSTGRSPAHRRVSSSPGLPLAYPATDTQIGRVQLLHKLLSAKGGRTPSEGSNLLYNPAFITR
jgi:hypothetical protein